MKTSFDSIEYVIKRLVEYQVKYECSDVRWDGSTKLLTLHPLSAAKHIAYDCGYSSYGPFYSKCKEITAHMRPYNQIKEMNSSIARDILHLIDDDSLLNSSPRYILNDKGEKVLKCVREYFDAGYGDDTIILFLVENEKETKDEIKEKEFGNHKHELVSKPTEDDESRQKRLTREAKEKDEKSIRNGRVVSAVEMNASVYLREYHYCDGRSEDFNWKDFRKGIAEQLNNGESECGAYKNTVQERIAWTTDCIEDVVELFKKYAFTHLDDRQFITKLVSSFNFPEFALFKNADDFEKYEENLKKINELHKSLDWPTLIKL